MPIFAVHAIDRPGTLQLRLDHYGAHRAYVEDQEAQGITVILSGPLQSDDGELMTGSLFVLEACDRAPIDAFVAHDPFTQHGVWGEVRISRFHPRKTKKTAE
ncbi:YciI family protein [Acidocella sp.]|uniref:YciI family protein n=1 Tax=Acidocella sp. TaxID=50710 RepID=UPI00262D0327|nr:YciI family protein [Acidocella sp.]